MGDVLQFIAGVVVVALLAVAAVASCLSVARLTGIYRTLRDDPAAGRAVTTHRAAGVRVPPEDRRRPDEVVTEPPMIDGVTLYQWLTTRSPHRDNVWPLVVREFYERAAAEPAVLAYFHRTLAKPDGMNILQGHFLRALHTVADKGITVGTLRYLRAKHARVDTLAGVPITGPVYDAVIATLVAVLVRYGVPQAGIAALGQTIEPIRAEIVRA
jgi:hypothetical protein